MATTATERLLNVEEAAIMLGTFNESGERYPRRLIAERRIRFVKLGRKVRIPESALMELIESATVQPVKLSADRTAA
jgi:excisionase family DNA binding protein